MSAAIDRAITAGLLQHMPDDHKFQLNTELAEAAARSADTLRVNSALPLTLAALSFGGIALLWWPMRRRLQVPHPPT